MDEASTNESRIVEREQTLNKDNETELTSIETTLNKDDIRTELVSTKSKSITIENESTSKNSKSGELIIKEDDSVIIKINDCEAGGDVDAEMETTDWAIKMQEIIDLVKDTKDDLNPDTTFWVFLQFYRLNAIYCRNQVYPCDKLFCYNPNRPFFLALTLAVVGWMYFLTYSIMNHVTSTPKERAKYETRPMIYFICAAVALFTTHMILLSWRWARRFPMNMMFCLITIWAGGTIATLLLLKIGLSLLASYFHTMALIMFGCLVMALFTMNFRCVRPMILVGVWTLIATIYVAYDNRLDPSFMNPDFMILLLSVLFGMFCWYVVLLMILDGRGRPMPLTRWDFFTAAYMLYMSHIQMITSFILLVFDLIFCG